MDELYLLRHAETEWSCCGKHTGKTDKPLTEKGIEEAKKVAPLLKTLSFSLILSSPLQRAIETATEAGLTYTIESALHEWDYGEYEGLTSQEIKQKNPGWNLFDQGAPKGESPEEVQERASRVLMRLEKVPGKVLIVSHGHFCRVLGACFLRLGVEEGKHLFLNTASLSILGYEHQTPVIKLWNFTAHLS